MNRARFLVVATLLASAASVAHAQRITYDFENLALNTIVTTQYDGVTFSVPEQSCSGAPVVSMRIRTATGGTSSGTRALGIDTGCPDFSPDSLRMVFDQPQSQVSFTLGIGPGTFQVRAYSTTSGVSGLLSTQTIEVGTTGVYRAVSVNAPAGTMRRIEIREAVGLFEFIDDLSFDLDDTPPIARIAAPTAAQCLCGTVLVSGTAFDPDGTYRRDTLEYKPADDDTWTVIGSATTPVEDGLLYNWNTDGLAEGFYLLKLTVENEVDLLATDTQLVWVSGDFDSASFSVPTYVGGTVCPDGTVHDDYCTGEYRVEYSRTSPIAYVPVDPMNPTYSGYRVNQQLASWNTATLDDGTYLLRVTGENACGETRAVSHSVVVDNTAPEALITFPASCGAVEGVVPVVGTARDTHIAGWSLWYTGGDEHAWAPIASGAGNMTNALLGAWDTRSLRSCQYTLKLVVTDRASVDCSVRTNQTEYTVSVFVGCDADFNADGFVNSQDFFDFLTAFFAGC